MNTDEPKPYHIIIPARMASKRLPGKPLVDVCGKSLLLRVYERASLTCACDVCVATPDNEIIDHCNATGMRVIQTTDFCASGTHRCAEVAAGIPTSYVVNWQCDEPLVNPSEVDSMMAFLSWKVKHSEGVITMVGPLENDECEECEEGIEYEIPLPGECADRPKSGCRQCYGGHSNRDVTKVILTASDHCLWFSRAPMKTNWAHVGVYGFLKATLERLGGLGPSHYSKAEGLEQLTWLENWTMMLGHRLRVTPRGINSEADLKYLRKVYG
jgi:3-deoxy-manno-octulosonate cytidylyltransferase (CMP-KDO synthetase)